MKKETIYTVCNKTNVVLRASKTLLSALEFGLTIPHNSFYLCTSEFSLKKGETMSNIIDFIEH